MYIRYVKHIFQSWPWSIFIYQCNSFCPFVDPAVKPATVPDVNTGTGRGIRTLCIDQKLLLKRVFINPCCCIQILFPCLPVFTTFFAVSSASFEINSYLFAITPPPVNAQKNSRSLPVQLPKVLLYFQKKKCYILLRKNNRPQGGCFRIYG